MKKKMHSSGTNKRKRTTLLEDKNAIFAYGRAEALRFGALELVR